MVQQMSQGTSGSSSHHLISEKTVSKMAFDVIRNMRSPVFCEGGYAIQISGEMVGVFSYSRFTHMSLPQNISLTMAEQRPSYAQQLSLRDWEFLSSPL